MPRKIIPIMQHPSNNDSAARRVHPVRWRGRDVYRVTGGFVAMLGEGMCFEGLFATKADAEMAQSQISDETVQRLAYHNDRHDI